MWVYPAGAMSRVLVCDLREGKKEKAPTRRSMAPRSRGACTRKTSLESLAQQCSLAPPRKRSHKCILHPRYRGQRHAEESMHGSSVCAAMRHRFAHATRLLTRPSNHGTCEGGGEGRSGIQVHGVSNNLSLLPATAPHKSRHVSSRVRLCGDACAAARNGTNRRPGWQRQEPSHNLS
jgi:hypothetical protein